MNSISFSSAGLKITTAPNRVAASEAATEKTIESHAPLTASPSTQLTLGKASDGLSVVYERPVTVQAAAPNWVQTKRWASNVSDGITKQIASNASSKPKNLAGFWSGLGHALLTRFSSDNPNYSQTLVNRSHFATETEGATAAQATEDLASLIKTGGTTVKLQIQTRSGQTVNVQIAIKDGQELSGIHVESSSSGELGLAERQAIAQLSEGLDRALQGLGQTDQAKLDLSGLMDYDTTLLSGIHLSIHNQSQGLAQFDEFELTLSNQQRSVSLKGPNGNLAVDLDMKTPLLSTDAAQRDAALTKLLQQFDVAAKRSHADETMATLFKQAFSQLQQHPVSEPQPAEISRNGPSPALTGKTASMLSGLTDFKASFHSESSRTNEFGAVTEVERSHYVVSQTTKTQPTSNQEDISVQQELTEKLDAHYLKARNKGILDTEKGNYDRVTVKDDTTVSTLIASTKGRISRAEQKTDSTKLHHWEKLENKRVQSELRLPQEVHILRLLPTLH